MNGARSSAKKNRSHMSRNYLHVNARIFYVTYLLHTRHNLICTQIIIDAIDRRFVRRTFISKMVSHFGEIVFPSSRAFWDDEDEYEPADNFERSPKLYVRWLKSKPEHMQKLIIMEGDPLIPFAERFCPKMEEACIIENENQRKVSVIYQIDKQIYMCIILPQFDTKNAGKLVNQISDSILSSESVISIVCRHVSQFQSTSIPEIPSFLRILTTKNANVIKYEIEPLEQPNIIFGVGAGVLSYAELVGMSAKLYILYIDSFVLDSKCVEPILQILVNEIPYKLQQPKFTENPFSKGNLYM